MGRRRTNLVPDKVPNETLSNETPEVVNTLLEEFVNTSENSEGLDGNKINIKTEIPKFSPGDKVKLKENVKFDILGHRIHNGIHNYTYTVKLQRDDDMVTIECMTIKLTVKPEDILKIYL